jgi:hypothetical protein
MLISKVWRKGAVPKDWRKALIVPLFKKGDPTNIDNYRGIGMLSLPGKVFAMVFKHRLQRWAEGLLLEGQCGFQKGRSCNNAIFSLNGLGELTGKTGNELHACFVDLSKAYDSVDRPLAWERLLAAWDFLQRCYGSSRTYMTTPYVQCKQTKKGRAAGSRSPQASSKVM